MQDAIDLVRGNIEIFLVCCLLVVFILSRLPRLVDPIFALLALASFTAFIGFLVVRLGEPDLAIVAIAVVVMVAIDFFTTVRDSAAGENGER